MSLFSKKPKRPKKQIITFISTSGTDPLPAILQTAFGACREKLLKGGWSVTGDRQETSGFHRGGFKYGLSSPHGTAFTLTCELETAWKPDDANCVDIMLGTADDVAIPDAEATFIEQAFDATEQAVREAGHPITSRCLRFTRT